MPSITRVTPNDYTQIGGDSVKITVEYKKVSEFSNNKVKIEYLNAYDNWIMISPNLLGQKSKGKTLYSDYLWNIKNITNTQSYYMRITLYDEDGNSDVEYITYTIDKEAPSDVESFKAVPDNGNVMLIWDPSKSSDCIKYNIYRKQDNEEYNIVATLSGRYKNDYLDQAVNSGEEYTYMITSVDNNGNESAGVCSGKKLVDIDQLPPQVEEVSPGTGKIHAITKLEILVSDNKKTQKVVVKYKKDEDTQWSTLGETTEGTDISGSGKYFYSIDTTKYSDGTYTFCFSAVDDEGNQSDDTYTRRYVIDNTGIAKINIAKQIVNTTSVQLHWDDVTESDFSYFQIEQLISGEYKKVGQVNNILGYTVAGLIPNTAYSFRVVGYDKLGNRGIASDVVAVITTDDEIKPVITSIYPTSSYYANNINLGVNASDNVGIDYAVFSYSYDKVNFIEIGKSEASNKQTSNKLNLNFNVTNLPEGTIYIKFEVYDTSGNKNALLTTGEEIIGEYKVDRTAPLKVENLNVSGCDGYIGLEWDAGVDKDISGYRIYRADGEIGVFKVLVAKSNTKNYYDTSVEYGKSYIYKISAIDIAGNESEISNEVYSTVMNDNVIPTVTSMSPYDGETLGANPTIKALVIDNSKIKNIVMEYKKADSSEDVWTEIKNVNISNQSYLLSCTWNTNELTDGKYCIRCYATDIYGNVSEEYKVTYIINTQGVAAPTIVAKGGNFEINISMGDLEDENFYYYEVFRKKVGENEYKKIVSTDEGQYKDTTVEINTVYYYKVRVVDIYGNETFSNVVHAYADDRDLTAPEAVLPDNIIGMVGMEIALDGMASTDNIKVAEYSWNMGNGDTREGGQTTYTYNEPGTYSIVLTVKDAAGNSNSTRTTVQILEKTGNGMSTVLIVDEKGIAIPHALVYVKLSDTEHISLKADNEGKVNVINNVGVYEVAAYKDGYLPGDINVAISEYENRNYTLKLVEDELIVGELSVKRMNLQEMVEAGVDFSNPSNYHTFVFSVDLYFALAPLPVRINYIISGDSSSQKEGKIYHYKTPDNKHKVLITRVAAWMPGSGNEPEEKPEEIPMVAYMSAGGNVSWLKEMYNVELGILNAADSKYSIIDSKATLTLPETGMSLAATNSTQTLTQDMGTINGQEKKSVSWIVRGDKSGNYTLSADFSGKLMPFDTPVSAHFETEESINVNTGEGLSVNLAVENYCLINGEYYIYYSIKNKSGRTLYNITPDFGEESSVSREITNKSLGQGEIWNVRNIIINNPRLATQTAILEGGQRVTFPVLPSGASYKTLYKTSVPSFGDPEKEYMILLGFCKKVKKGSDLGVDFKVSVIGSHASLKVRDVYEVIPRSSYADPVDVASGAFTDVINSLSVTGGSEISNTLSYDSRITDTKGEFGYGWNDIYGINIEEENGIITFNSNTGIKSVFVNNNALSFQLCGTMVEDSVILDDSEDYSYGEYTCINEFMSDYKLVKNVDNTYAMILPNSSKYIFDIEGRLIKMYDSNNNSISILYQNGQKIIVDDISNRRVKYTYNADGMVTIVSDDIGRNAKFVYDIEGRLISYTNPVGAILKYTYDDENRIIKETLNNTTVNVSNEYDEKGRVVCQTNAENKKVTFCYKDNPFPSEYSDITEEYGNYLNNGMTVTITDEMGYVKSAVVDKYEQIIEVTNENGGKTQYTYDNKGNVLCEIDSYGNATYKEYDDKGNILSVTDTGNNTTLMNYDKKGNVVSIESERNKKAYFVYNSKNQMKSKTDYNGTTTTYEYNEQGLLVKETTCGLGSILYGYTDGQITSVTDYNGNTSYSEYDEVGRLTKSIDAMGNITQREYDALGNVVKVVDALGGVTSYSFDIQGNMTTKKDAAGNVTSYFYDVLGRQTKATYADGTSLTYTYDALGNKIKTTYPDGTSSLYKYDESRNLIKEVMPDGSCVEYEYDLLNERISETGSNGTVIKYEYYPNGNIHKEIYPDGTYILYTYNKNWKVISVTDQSGHTSSYSYDAMGRVVKENDPVGNVTGYTYDNAGRLIAVTDANGNVTKYTYDGKGNCIKSTDALSHNTYFEYDKLNRLIKAHVIDMKGEEYSICYIYDALGRVISQTDEEGNSTYMTYDAMSNLISTKDALGNIVLVNTYNSMGRTVSSTNAVGMTTDFEYDTKGNLVKTIQSLNSAYVVNSDEGEQKNTNKEVNYSYDALGRVKEVVDSLNGVTKTYYDNAGNISTITDAKGGSTSYKYNALNQVVSETNAIGIKTEYTYNSEGLLKDKIDGNLTKTTYGYDAAGKIISMNDELGTVMYTYDHNGNVLQVIDQSGTINREYDALNRITKYTDAKGNTVKYSYDEIGNLISLTYPGGKIARYKYYKNGKLKSVEDVNNLLTLYEYDAVGQLINTVRPNGTREIRTYNAAGYLTSILDVAIEAHTGEETVLNNYSYTYDSYGNIILAEGTNTTSDGCNIAALNSCEMTYDADNRLKTYNGEEVKYDANGNMTYGPVKGTMQSLKYDCRNRLVGVGNTTYTYDAQNNRVGKIEDGITYEYVVDTASFALPQVLVETSKMVNGTTVGDNKVVSIPQENRRYYTYGNGLISEATADEIYYHHYNNIGNTTKLTDSTGKVVSAYTYGVYGELLSGDTTHTSYLYNGRYGITTENNGLYYMNSRYYNPLIKRFINRDVVNGSISNSQSLNKYAYVQGNPVSMVDPFGTSPMSGLFSGGGLFSGSFDILGAVHVALDVAGSCVGVVGIISNAVNAGLYAVVDHDYGMAALSALSAVTLGAANVAKNAGRLSNTAKLIEAGCKTVSNVANFAINTQQVADIGSKMYESYILEGKEFGSQGIFEVAMLGLSIFGAVNSATGALKSGKEVGNILKENSISSQIKDGITSFASNNGGYVDLGADVGGKSGNGSVDAYDGVKQASEYLKQQGVPRQYRKQILESFDVGTIKLETAGDSTYGLRFYGGNANAEGRYLFETFSPLTNRENLALPYDWNGMTGIQQFQVKNGTTMLTGAAAPQTGFGNQYIGGAKQWYINNLEDLIKCQ